METNECSYGRGGDGKGFDIGGDGEKNTPPLMYPSFWVIVCPTIFSLNKFSYWGIRFWWKNAVPANPHAE